MSRYVVAIAAAAATGIITWIVFFGEIPYRMQDGKQITVTGQMVCLPHERGLFSGPETEECAFGFRGQSGEHYAIDNIAEIVDKEPLLEDSIGGPQEFVLSGMFTYSDYRNYDVVGTIVVDKVELLIRQ